MTCGIIVPTLGSNIWKLFVFYEKKSYFMGILKIWDPFINHMTMILRGLISNLNIYRALNYITKIKVFCYVDKKCKILTHSYHPRGGFINICNWANKAIKRCILCIHIKL
jgi:hypothetical protein